MNWVRYGGSTTLENQESSSCHVAQQGLLCYMEVARLGFKRHAKSNLIWLIEFGTAVARCLKRAFASCYAIDKIHLIHRGRFCPDLPKDIATHLYRIHLTAD